MLSIHLAHLWCKAPDIWCINQARGILRLQCNDRRLTMAYIKDFNLITENDLRKLEAFGIRTCAQLVERASTPADRMNIADRINVNDSDLKNLAHHCDMMRVKGMTPPLAIALCNAGVCTVPKLAYQNALSLRQRLSATNPDTIDRRLLEQLIASAKTLPKMIRH